MILSFRHIDQTQETTQERKRETNMVYLFHAIFNVLAAANPTTTNPCSWSPTHTIYDAASRGCITTAEKLKRER